MVPDPLIPLSCLAHVDRTKAAIPRITTAATFRIHIDLAPDIIIGLAPNIGFSSHCATRATRIGPPAVPALIAALQEGEILTRAGAARALSIIQSKDAIPALCAALDDSSAIVTYYAEEALERMGVGLVLFRP